MSATRFMFLEPGSSFRGVVKPCSDDVVSIMLLNVSKVLVYAVKHMLQKALPLVLHKFNHGYSLYQSG